MSCIRYVAGLVELWAAGGTLGQITASNNMDDRDIDLLLPGLKTFCVRSICQAAYLLEPLKIAA